MIRTKEWFSHGIDLLERVAREDWSFHGFNLDMSMMLLEFARYSDATVQTLRAEKEKLLEEIRSIRKQLNETL
jgi:hypothetical protein